MYICEYIYIHTDAASQYSTCPSKAQAGSLGSFKPGMMVAEFDQVQRTAYTLQHTATQYKRVAYPGGEASLWGLEGRIWPDDF